MAERARDGSTNDGNPDDLTRPHGPDRKEAAHWRGVVPVVLAHIGARLAESHRANFDTRLGQWLRH